MNYGMNYDIRRVKDRRLRNRGLKFWFTGLDGKTIYAATRKAAKKVRSYEHGA
jgi:hypothetical protein